MRGVEPRCLSAFHHRVCGLPAPRQLSARFERLEPGRVLQKTPWFSTEEQLETCLPRACLGKLINLPRQGFSTKMAPKRRFPHRVASRTPAHPGATLPAFVDGVPHNQLFAKTSYCFPPIRRVRLSRACLGKRSFSHEQLPPQKEKKRKDGLLSHLPCNRKRRL